MSDDKDAEKRRYYNKKEVEAFSYNPFAEALCTTIKLGKKVTGYVNAPIGIHNEETGEIIDSGARIGVSKVVDREEFVKFFGAGIINAFDLPKSAQKVFQLLMGVYLATKTTQANMDKLYFNYKVAVEDWGYDKTQVTFTNGLNSLINSGIVAHVKSHSGWLWLNTSFFAKGDRVVLYNEYIVEGSETHRKIIEQDAKRAQMIDAKGAADKALKDFKLTPEKDGE